MSGPGVVGVVAPVEDAAPEPRPRRQAVDPRHRVLELLVRLAGDREELRQVPDDEGLGVDGRGDDGAKAERSPQDEAGEPQPAHRGLEEVAVLPERAGEPLPVGAKQLERLHVRTERPVPVVVLAVDVVRDGAADRDLLRAGHHRQEEPARDDEPEDLAQRDPRLAGEEPPLRIEREEAVEPAGGEKHAAVVEAGVAVAPPQAVGEDRLAHGDACIRRPVERDDLGAGAGEATPGLERNLRHRRHVPSRITAAPRTATAQLVGSRMANTTGSSSTSPRQARSHMREIQ